MSHQIKVLYNCKNRFIHGLEKSNQLYETIAKICSSLQSYQFNEFEYFFSECFVPTQSYLLCQLPDISFIELNLILIVDKPVEILSANWGFAQDDMKRFTTLRGIDYETNYIRCPIKSSKPEYDYNKNSLLTYENLRKHNEI